ncbi:MAG: DUF1559 domain-containing protein [Armatimonadota bacterium]|nr:DUF1559 domain-containing protein [Armatimonadota bacterium]
MFPVFSRAREKARQTQCLSNVKQIALAVNMYVQDYDETFPTIYCWYDPPLPDYPLGWGVVHSWKVAVAPYIKNDMIWVCPSMVKQGGSDPHWMYHPEKGGYGGTLYYVFCYAPWRGYWFPYGPTGGGPVTLACIEHPARVIMIAETNHHDYAYYSTDPSKLDYYLAFRHNEMLNAAFVDGHAKAVERGFCAQSKHWDPRIED